MMNDQSYRLRINPIKSEASDDEEADDAAPSESRWEVPDSLFGKTRDDYGMRHAWNRFKLSNNTNMEFASIKDASDKYISTQDTSLIFTEYYLEMGFVIESQNIFGFGERMREFELTPGNYSSWSNGRDNHYDKGEEGNHSYGDHPFVLFKLKNSFGGIFFKNSNAKSLEYSRHRSTQSLLTFRAAGGVHDYFFFFGESAESVIKAYHGVIGYPYFPPFWSLGFHQSSWQCNETKRVNEVLKGYDNANMPLEALWLDIEYMNSYRNFEVNTTRFENIPNLAQALHQKKQKLVTIVDAGFEANKDYSYYRQGTEQKLFIKSANSASFDENLIGRVWPGKLAFVDFACPESTEFWVNGLTGLWTATNTDGIWIDMNEVTTFWDGECLDDKSESAQAKSYLFDPTGKYKMQTMSLSLDGQHWSTNDTEKALNIEFNQHSLYGTLQAKATYDFWIKGTKLQGKRPFVLSRSTFAGAGKYTSHWLGDNFSRWNYLAYSVSGIMNFQMFGIPHVGADVWVFHEKFDQEMCGRWMQLSVFYPFARNHYNLTDNGKEFLPPQEPYNLQDKFKETSRKAIQQRYSFLRYYYTQLFEISKSGGTLVRPLFFEFPSDKNVYQNYESTFMIRSALKATPVMAPENETKNKINSYFPAKSRFISLNDFKTIKNGGKKRIE